MLGAGKRKLSIKLTINLTINLTRRHVSDVSEATSSGYWGGEERCSLSLPPSRTLTALSFKNEPASETTPHFWKATKDA